MADYIRPGLIAEAYVNLYDHEFAQAWAEPLRDFTRERAFSIARDTFQLEVRIEVEVEIGSLKIRSLVYFVAGGIALFITKYGDFRQGIDYISRQ